MLCSNVNINQVIKNHCSWTLKTIYWFLPDHAFTAGQLIYQEGQYSGFLSRRVSLKGFGPQTPSKISKLSLRAVSLHVQLQNLRHIIPIQTHIGQVVTQDRLSLMEKRELL